MEKVLLSKRMDTIFNKEGYNCEIISGFDETAQLNIEITTKCNTKCIYCYYSQTGVHKNGTYINKDIFEKVVQEAYDLGIRSVGLYAIGDPLCHPEVEYFIRRVKEIGYTYIFISTNGILCNQDKLKKMIEAGLDSIKFTISAASAENYVKHHGVDAFEIVKKNIIDTYEYRKKIRSNFKIYIFYIITRFNYDELEKFKELFSPYCDEIVANEVITGVIPMKGVKEHLYVTDNKYFKRNIPCVELWNRVMVGVDGSLYQCCGVVDEKSKVYNLKVGTLLEGINCEKMVQLRKEHLSKNIENDICKSCLCVMSGQIDYKECKLGCIDITDEIKRRFVI